jgi:hypothetical protein
VGGQDTTYPRDETTRGAAPAACASSRQVHFKKSRACRHGRAHCLCVTPAPAAFTGVDERQHRREGADRLGEIRPTMTGMTIAPELRPTNSDTCDRSSIFERHARVRADASLRIMRHMCHGSPSRSGTTSCSRFTRSPRKPRAEFDL